MKHLVSVTVIVTALMMAAPISAQTSAPITPTSSAPQSEAPKAPTEVMPSHRTPAHWMGHRRANATRLGSASGPGPAAFSVIQP